MSSLLALPVWQLVLIGYLVTGAIIMNIPRARREIFSILTPEEIESMPRWKVYSTFSVELVVSLALWPLFVKDWLFGTSTLLRELQADEGYQSMVAINKAMAELSIDGCDTDEIPGSNGDFGYDISNPVPTQGIQGSTRYLGRLRAQDGTKVAYSRIGSFTSSVTSNLVDGYLISHADGTALGTLYVAPYNKRNSTKAPEGLSLVLVSNSQASAMFNRQEETQK